MPRNWRCANGHTWTGDLGALTFCPDCGSSDVYEVRPQYQSGAVPSSAAAAATGDQTFIQPAAVNQGASASGRSGQSSVGDTLTQPVFSAGAANAGAANAGDTLAQPFAQPSSVGDTYVQPAFRSSDTLVQSPDPGTTQHQAFQPETDGGTLIQTPAVGFDRSEGEGTLVQAPIQSDPSTLDMPILGNEIHTLDQPTGTTAEGPTFVAPNAPPFAETRMFAAPPVDGGSAPQTPADTPTLDSPGADGALFRTADYPSTVSVHRGARGPGPGLSGQDTKVSPPPPRGRDGRTAAPPPVDGYEILGVLGRGGMGVVYKARHIRLNRIVALKMILAGGHAGAYEKQRFETEMKAVADLQHPNIVQIFDVGERDKLPYFSLEFCDGGSLQQKLGGQPMPPKTAADVAEQLSRAMQFAHERGIVHRDLKPANILFAGEEAAASKDKAPSSKDSKVASKGAKSTTRESKVASRDTGKDASQSKSSQSKSVSSFLSSRTSASTASLRTSRVTPKVTDFGLAKRLEDDSGLTGSGTILGTPSYMAPEQAAGKTRSVGPSADIHALGAILYEMLTGRPPFLGESVVETMNQVRTMEPVPPSRIQPKTPRDLETICLKCLQKEMHKRYASAGDLADDLRAFLDGHPIAARPVPAWEKAYKWAKRRPAQAALIALSLAVLIGSAVGGIAFGRHENAQRLEADRLRSEAVTQFQHAEANFMSAREAVDSLLVRVGAERLEHVPKAEKLRRELLEQSLAFYNRFLQEHGDDAAVKREAGWAFQRVGRIRNDLGDRKAAIDAYGEAVKLFVSLSAEPSDKQNADRFDLARTRRQLAVILEADNRPAEADAAYQAARETLRELADANADQPMYRAELADLLLNRGAQFYNRRHLVEAEDFMRQALTEYDRLCRNSPTADNLFRRAKAQADFAAVILVSGRTNVAFTELDKAIDLLTALIKGYPGNPEHVALLGQTINNKGTAQWQAGEFDNAEATYRDSIQKLTKLTEDFPKTYDYRFTLAKAYDNLAVFLLSRPERGGLRVAEPERQNARTLFKQLVDEVPDNAEYRHGYAKNLSQYAAYLVAMDRLSQAVEQAKAAADMVSQLVTGDPTNPDLVSHLATLRLNLGQLYAQVPQPAEASIEYAQAAALFEELARQRVADDKLWQELPDTYWNQALVFQGLGQGSSAERSMRRSVAVARKIVAAHADQPDAIAKSAKIEANLAVLPTIKPEESLNLLREAVRWQRAALALAPKNGDLARDLGSYSLALMDRLVDQGYHAEVAKEAEALAHEVVFMWLGWPNVAGKVSRCVRLVRTDKNLTEDQKAKLASAYGQQALDLLQKAVDAGYKNVAFLQDSPDLEVLRTDLEFRPKFQKIIASINSK
jgi:eukaryotic-like serine/threonine-protein kinase